MQTHELFQAYAQQRKSTSSSGIVFDKFGLRSSDEDLPLAATRDFSYSFDQFSEIIKTLDLDKQLDLLCIRFSESRLHGLVEERTKIVDALIAIPETYLSDDQVATRAIVKGQLVVEQALLKKGESKAAMLLKAEEHFYVSHSISGVSAEIKLRGFGNAAVINAILGNVGDAQFCLLSGKKLKDTVSARHPWFYLLAAQAFVHLGEINFAINCALWSEEEIENEPGIREQIRQVLTDCSHRLELQRPVANSDSRELFDNRLQGVPDSTLDRGVVTDEGSPHTPDGGSTLPDALATASSEEFAGACALLPVKKLSALEAVMRREEAYARWERILKGVQLRGKSVQQAVREINSWISQKSITDEFDSVSNNRRDTLAKCLREIRDTLGRKIMHGEDSKRTTATIRTYNVQDGTKRKRFIVERSGGGRESLETSYGIPTISFE